MQADEERGGEFDAFCLIRVAAGEVGPAEAESVEGLEGQPSGEGDAAREEDGEERERLGLSGPDLVAQILPGAEVDHGGDHADGKEGGVDAGEVGKGEREAHEHRVFKTLAKRLAVPAAELIKGGDGEEAGEGFCKVGAGMGPSDGSKGPKSSGRKAGGAAGGEQHAETPDDEDAEGRDEGIEEHCQEAAAEEGLLGFLWGEIGDVADGHAGAECRCEAGACGAVEGGTEVEEGGAEQGLQGQVLSVEGVGICALSSSEGKLGGEALRELAGGKIGLNRDDRRGATEGDRLGLAKHQLLVGGLEVSSCHQ